VRVRQKIQTVPRKIELTDIPQHTRVVAGILHNAKRQVLITDRAQADSMQDLWEFPGGKIEHGESARAALTRELKEELGISQLEFEHFQNIEHDYLNFRVSIDFFVVSCWHGTPAGSEGQQLRWVDQDELVAEILLPADAPVLNALWERLASTQIGSAAVDI